MCVHVSLTSGRYWPPLQTWDADAVRFEIQGGRKGTLQPSASVIHRYSHIQTHTQTDTDTDTETYTDTDTDTFAQKRTVFRVIKSHTHKHI